MHIASRSYDNGNYKDTPVTKARIAAYTSCLSGRSQVNPAAALSQGVVAAQTIDLCAITTPVECLGPETFTGRLGKALLCIA